MKSAEEIFEKFKQIYLSGGSSSSQNSDPTPVYQPPPSHPSGLNRSRIQRIDKHRGYAPPARPTPVYSPDQAAPSSSRPTRQASSRIDYSDMINGDQDSDISEYEESSTESEISDTAGQLSDDQLVPEY